MCWEPKWDEKGKGQSQVVASISCSLSGLPELSSRAWPHSSHHDGQKLPKPHTKVNFFLWAVLTGVFILVMIKVAGAGEMAQWLQAFPALAEVLSSDPSTMLITA